MVPGMSGSAGTAGGPGCVMTACGPGCVMTACGPGCVMTACGPGCAMTFCGLVSAMAARGSALLGRCPVRGTTWASFSTAKGAPTPRPNATSVLDTRPLPAAAAATSPPTPTRAMTEIT